MIPRICASVGKILEGEDAGKWGFGIWITQLDAGDPQGEPDFLHGPYDTEEAAQAAMREACHITVKAIQEHYGEAPTGDAINMKTNRLVNLDPKRDN